MPRRQRLLAVPAAADRLYQTVFTMLPRMIWSGLLMRKRRHGLAQSAMAGAQTSVFKSTKEGQRDRYRGRDRDRERQRQRGERRGLGC
jgi:hypothetical protein